MRTLAALLLSLALVACRTPLQPSSGDAVDGATQESRTDMAHPRSDDMAREPVDLAQRQCLANAAVCTVDAQCCSGLCGKRIANQPEGICSDFPPPPQP
jgi:hypothetical protein